MHPGMMGWWKHRHRGGWSAEAHCGPDDYGSGGEGWSPGEGYFAAPFEGGFDGGAFGVRRPLRYLAYKLRLNEAQVGQLAGILNDLKTERAQAAVDERRTAAAFADAVAADAFGEAGIAEATAQRVKSAERVQAAVARALARIHALLEPEQRARLAYLLRTGALSM